MATTLLEEALDGWRFTRDGVIAELENIPAESFDFRPTSGVRTVAELARRLELRQRPNCGWMADR